jgi:tRNA nucleotidyltransferase/poly(A) polymerase
MDLEKLKKLRTRRMEQCFIALQTQRQTVLGWQNHVQQKEQQLAEFQQWRLAHQEALFADLKHQPFNPQALLNYQAKLEEFRQQEDSIRAELANTYQALHTANTHVETARQESVEANIKLEKLKEIIQLHDEQKSSEELVQ